ncbi:hypothetical protein GCM10019017_67210 [Streptomyces showdoensis]
MEGALRCVPTDMSTDTATEAGAETADPDLVVNSKGAVPPSGPSGPGSAAVAPGVPAASAGGGAAEAAAGPGGATCGPRSWRC